MRDLPRPAVLVGPAGNFTLLVLINVHLAECVHQGRKDQHARAVPRGLPRKEGIFQAGNVAEGKPGFPVLDRTVARGRLWRDRLRVHTGFFFLGRSNETLGEKARSSQICEQSAQSGAWTSVTH